MADLWEELPDPAPLTPTERGLIREILASVNRIAAKEPA